MKKDFTQIFWGIDGEGIIYLEGTPHRLGKNEVALYFPEDWHEVHATSKKPWEYRWWTMDGPLAAPIVKAFGLGQRKIYKAGPAPVPLFHELQRCIRDVTLDGERTAGLIAYELLTSAARSVEAHSGDASRQAEEAFKTRVLAEMDRRWMDSTFGIEELARLMQIPRWGLTRKFRVAFGISPSEYLQRWRVQEALRLLTETRIPINEISQRCGWSDPNYFSRSIKKATQLTPAQFRKD